MKFVLDLAVAGVDVTVGRKWKKKSLTELNYSSIERESGNVYNFLTRQENWTHN